MTTHEPASGPAPRLLVAITTYCRTERLAPLVRAVRTEAARTDASTRVLLLDNDADASARPIAAQLGTDYRVEPTPGIAAARQAALDAAGDDELIVMIDDDLMPEEGWLSHLLTAWQTYRPTAVMGFVRYVWPEGTDPRIAEGGFMRRTRFPTGTRLTALSTGNVLLDVARVRELGIRFDTSLGLSGGEDLAFSQSLLQRGGTIVASAESVVRDDIVPSRTSWEFVRRRAICQGQVRVRVLSAHPERSAVLAMRSGHLVGGLIRVPIFALHECLSLVRADVNGSAEYRRRRWFAQGRILGAIGRTTPEYARSAPTRPRRPSQTPEQALSAS